jgi:dihydrofolate reductase
MTSATATRRVIANLFVSADGFAADRAEEATWITDAFGEEIQRYVAETHAMDVMLLGRVSYEILAAYWPTATVEDDPMAERMNEVPKLVFSKKLSGPLEWETARLAEGALEEEVAALKATPGGEIGIAGSVSIGQQLARAGLLDGYRLMIHPVVLGAAGYKPVFAGFDLTRLRLFRSRVLDARVVAVEYEIAKGGSR